MKPSDLKSRRGKHRRTFDHLKQVSFTKPVWERKEIEEDGLLRERNNV